MKIQKFEDLDIWQDSTKIAKQIYILTKDSIVSKDYGFCDQIRRASVSISCNIAEGFEKSGKKEFIRFLKIAKGSAGEVRSLLYVGQLLNYFNNKDFELLQTVILSLSKRIGGLIKYLQTTI